MNKFRIYIDQVAKVSDEDWNLFSSKLRRKEFFKKSQILEIGQVENEISYVEEGVVRLFIPKEDSEKEITFGFCFQNEFVSAYESF